MDFARVVIICHDGIPPQVGVAVCIGNGMAPGVRPYAKDFGYHMAAYAAIHVVDSIPRRIETGKGRWITELAGISLGFDTLLYCCEILVSCLLP
jgi:hypothetical protein